MGLRGELQEALPGMFDAAEDASFTPAAGASVPCKVFIDFNVSLEPAGFEGMTQQTGTVIEALLNGNEASPDGIAISRPPVRDETFTLAGIIYTVARILTNDGFTVKMAVK